MKKCKKCGKKFPEHYQRCPYCKSVYIKFKISDITILNKILLLIFLIQLIAAVVLLAIPGGNKNKTAPDSKQTVISYQKNKKYDDIIKCIEKNDTLKDDPDIDSAVYDAVSEIEADYLAGELTYNMAMIELKKFESLLNGKYKDHVEQVKKNTFESSYDKANFNADEAAENISDELELAKLIDSRKKYHIFAGANSAFSLSLEYDKLTGMNTAKDIDALYQAYIKSCIDEKSYKKVIDALDKDFDYLSENKDYFDLEKYKGYLTDCGEKMISQCIENNNYLGNYGAIKTADRINKHIKDAIDKKSITDSFIALTGKEMLEDLNKVRKDVYGLSPVKENEDLTAAVTDMLSTEGFSKLSAMTNDDFWDKFDEYADKYGISYQYAYYYRGGNSADYLKRVFTDIEKYAYDNSEIIIETDDNSESIDFLKEGKFTEAGVGIVQYADSDLYNYYVMAIEP